MGEKEWTGCVKGEKGCAVWIVPLNIAPTFLTLTDHFENSHSFIVTRSR